MLARLALLAARRAGAATPTPGLPALNAALRGGGGATTSADAAAACGSHPRRGAASTSDSSSSSSAGHIPHLTRPSADRRAETTKWSLLHEQGHDVNPCNSK